MQQTKRGRSGFLTHGLVALAAIVAAYFFVFHGYYYVFAPSFKPGPGCSPAAAGFLAGNGRGKRIRVEESNCASGSADIALYLDDGSGSSSQPFLIFDGRTPVIHAAWASSDSVSLDIVGDDIGIDYARDRVRGVRMNYAMRSAPTGAHRPL